MLCGQKRRLDAGTPHVSNADAFLEKPVKTILDLPVGIADFDLTGSYAAPGYIPSSLAIRCLMLDETKFLILLERTLS